MFPSPFTASPGALRVIGVLHVIRVIGMIRVIHVVRIASARGQLLCGGR
ncbi:putative membrane protein [Streptomyces scabiei 87.22]|uniref:Putative membrane protein n=1 Tax=Streptomyces scabiei (strain 87.22) TaxID=680198 RepID=C9Z2H7_STRSW|nr:putative membrane protein [Streptomyces scabiei 87.22]